MDMHVDRRTGRVLQWGDNLGPREDEQGNEIDVDVVTVDRQVVTDALEQLTAPSGGFVWKANRLEPLPPEAPAAAEVALRRRADRLEQLRAKRRRGDPLAPAELAEAVDLLMGL